MLQQLDVSGENIQQWSLGQSDHLHAIAIQLVATKSGKLPASLNRAVHSQVMTWMNNADAELSEWIHNTQSSPLSISGLTGRRRKHHVVKPGDEFTLRVGVLHGDLLPPLMAGLDKWGTEKVVIAKFPFAMKKVCAMPGTHPWVGSSQYSLLAQTPLTNHEITLEFKTPTSFKQGKKRIQTFLLPELVFSGLRKRWNAFAPEHLKIPFVEEWTGFVAAYELKTHALRMEGGSEKGAQGWVTYQFPDPEQARIASILAHFAFFAGVGRKTAMGMGQTRVRS